MAKKRTSARQKPSGHSGGSKPSAPRAGKPGSARRLFYWGLVGGVWAFVLGIVGFIWLAHDLPMCPICRRRAGKPP
ncbi:hypothetical protein JCM17845_13800 [Iodidimonas gelatinilytica]|uniref:Uncharacterized protein n=1 Tax=Iodidimonas gelatinilytica TaxID=1236966 RepID=A0A5A7MY00_9PROT|nr:hypothetical protein [Iodidimonas gelatinilytica]GER00757.1 hypothetical protein JCM17845_13800 [Iodidimonas gelatinilytica]